MKPTSAEPASGDYNAPIMNVRRRAIVLALVVLAPAVARSRASATSADQAAQPASRVTFSKDVDPIFQPDKAYGSLTPA